MVRHDRWIEKSSRTMHLVRNVLYGLTRPPPPPCFRPLPFGRLRNAWHLPGGVGALANTTGRRVLATRADGSQTVEEAKGAAGMGSADRKAILNSLRSQVSFIFHSPCLYE